MFIYEHKHQKVISRGAFSLRLTYNALIALALVSFALAVGMTGYMWLGGLNVVDAFYNAAMILSGMGPADQLTGHDGVKIFAGVYAIACGLLLFAVAGIVLAPLLHRILHRFHVQDKDSGN